MSVRESGNEPDRHVPNDATIRSEDTFGERRSVVGAKRAGSMDLVPETREEHLALPFKFDLLPVAC